MCSLKNDSKMVMRSSHLMKLRLSIIEVWQARSSMSSKIFPNAATFANSLRGRPGTSHAQKARGFLLTCDELLD